MNNRVRKEAKRIMRTCLLEQLLPGIEDFDACEVRLSKAMDEAVANRIQVTPQGRLPKQDEEHWNELLAHLGMVVDPTHNITTDRKIRFCHKTDLERLKEGSR